MLDFGQLKYALRSLEKYAPWINHIYLVTNGQSPPVWLDINNADLTVIHHDQFFRNLSHLPTFASPAIEANLHLIPGLAEKFLYFNDDLALVSQVCPSDFITKDGAYKSYFSYEVVCNENFLFKCHYDMVRNNRCDSICNTASCQFDGGDCLNEQPKQVSLSKNAQTKWRASLDYVSMKFNEKFGPKRRYNVPHIPLLVDKRIMKGSVFKKKNFQSSV